MPISAPQLNTGRPRKSRGSFYKLGMEPKEDEQLLEFLKANTMTMRYLLRKLLRDFLKEQRLEKLKHS